MLLYHGTEDTPHGVSQGQRWKRDICIFLFGSFLSEPLAFLSFNFLWQVAILDMICLFIH